MLWGPAARLCVLLGAVIVGFGTVAAFGTPGSTTVKQSDAEAIRARVKRAFARPKAIPQPPDNPITPEKVALGERLFNDPRLSSNGKISCASCHDPRLAFTDGVPTGEGVTGRPLKRHTPTLWNLAWARRSLMWDGRSESLELQAKEPIQNPDEMGETLERIVERLSRDPEYRAAFASAFPSDPKVRADNLLKALAAYERTLVSPKTRFDLWVEGDENALTEEEKKGFDLFIGKARCINCHTGFAFTDHSFHDIGLPSEDDLGRGPVVGLERLNFAFKTPGLRELAWTAPYMHDGSMETLEEVIRHYEAGGVDRPTRSREMPSRIDLTDEERQALIAFLYTLSSENPPKPSQEFSLSKRQASLETASGDEKAVATATVSQRNKEFTPGHVVIKRGEVLTILNDDTRTHNVRIYDPRFDFNSGAQEPGETITIALPTTGTFKAFCGIHPNMELTIEVE